ncbi:hypothetical protein [Pseudobutyrivibrio xylanivorans]|uniref:Uncharacterized protein n=1 Tax=Pseudobutyrivibrio xylanivorans TaxID=185007 RepID=A0A1G5S192_PSEXY|nr:hypothetical protein [Pseudobutyrivibrio xylanivorans]SCZ80083.1 hypothetical protein SAMN02910350_02107 [Pseudobutyrivibrio xylanivorans]
MKNRSVQAITIGLSALSLVAPTGMTMYAQAAEAVNDAETTTEQQLFSDSGEKAIAEEVSNLSEQLNTNTTSQLSEAASAPAAEGQFDQEVSAVLENEATVKDAVGSVSASLDNIVKAGEAIGEAQTQVQDAVSQADSAIKNVGEATSAANEQAQDAVSIIKDENVSEADAATIIADTDKTVEEAQTAFDEAENKYNDALLAYNIAKDDYETALVAYNLNKEEATGNLAGAESALESARAHLDDLQKQLESAQKELADAGADALVAAENAAVNASDEDRMTYANTYVAAILQYYYLPKVEGLLVGQTIENLRIEPLEDDGSRVSVIYSIANEDKKVVREVYAIYGCIIDKETWQVQIYSKKYMEIQVPVSPKKESKKPLLMGSAKKANNSFEERYINVGDEMWMQFVTDYTTYISGVRAKIDAYNSLLASVEIAKADFQDARDKVASIKLQIEELNKATDLNSAAEMARLEGLLESAQLDYTDAKENLESAKATLSDAKMLFNEKFVKATPVPQNSSSGSAQSSGTLASNIARLEARIDQELVELEEIQDEVTPTTAGSGAEVSVINEAEVAGNTGKSEMAGAEKSASKDKVVQPQDILPVPDEIVTIDEENIPLAITLAGMIQHAKWFIALGGVSLAGGLVGLIEVKRRAATKVIDKLNQ